MNDETLEIHQWERKAIAGLLGLLVTVFGVWAGVVYSGTERVVQRIDALSAQATADRLEQERYRTAMERRLTILEQQVSIISQRQAWVIDRLNGRKDQIP